MQASVGVHIIFDTIIIDSKNSTKKESHFILLMVSHCLENTMPETFIIVMFS